MDLYENHGEDETWIDDDEEELDDEWEWDDEEEGT
jgi:hypothetical protein